MFQKDISQDYGSLLDLAIQIAEKAHEGQLDKADKPYILHPLTVMAQMDDVQSKIVGVLHDAIEDSDLTITELSQRGFPELITEAIAAITKLDSELYDDYLLRVMGNAIALKVKIADVRHNMDISRIANPTVKDFQRLEKYQKVLNQLTARMK